MSTMRSAAAAGMDFADVYQEQLAPVWRYVRSRIWSYHDAQDVTAEVFARAWRSWPSYNPSRGGVAPWLFRIAHCTVVGWLRRRGNELPDGRPSFGPGVASVSDSLEAALLDQGVLVRLGVGARGAERARPQLRRTPVRGRAQERGRRGGARDLDGGREDGAVARAQPPCRLDGAARGAGKRGAGTDRSLGRDGGARDRRISVRLVGEVGKS